MGLVGIVEEFVNALCQRDKKKVLSYLTSDVVIEHPARPEGKIEGTAQFEGLIDGFFQWVEDGKVEVIRTVKSENTVWIERKDIWKIEGKWVDVPIVGIFEFGEDKISRWVEYLDFGYMNQFKTRPGDNLHKK